MGKVTLICSVILFSLGCSKFPFVAINLDGTNQENSSSDQQADNSDDSSVSGNSGITDSWGPDFRDPGKMVVCDKAQILATKNIKLTINNSTSFNYENDPVTSGVPFGEELNIKSTDSLTLTDVNNVEIPAQYRILSRWGELTDQTKPIRWVLVDFQTSVPAGTKKEFFLKYNLGSEVVESGIMVDEQTDYMLVKTGAAIFKINKKRFNIFDSVKLVDNQIELIDNSAEQGIIIERNKHLLKNKVSETATEVPANKYNSANDTPTVTIEEKGGLRTVIKVQGKFIDANGNLFKGGDARPVLSLTDPAVADRPASRDEALTYTVRMHFYKNKSYVKVFYTLENKGSSITIFFATNDVFIDGNYLQLNPSFASSAQVLMDNSAYSSVDFNLFQTHILKNPSDELENFIYDVRAKGTVLKSGDRSDGFVYLKSAQAGLAVGMNKFWQNFDKSVEIDKGLYRLGLLVNNDRVPEEPSDTRYTNFTTGKHYYCSDWKKTYETYFIFTKNESFDQVHETFNRLKKPLFALVDSVWFSETKAWSLISPHSIKTNSVERQRAFDLYEQYVEIPIDPRTENQGRDMTYLRESRAVMAGAAEYNKVDFTSWYGWESFGDMSHHWGDFANLIYDWSYIVWLQYIRKGLEPYRELGFEMIDHSISMDQRNDGINMWENSSKSPVYFHHLDVQNAGAGVSHTWNAGYYLAYLLTGDMRYQEAAQRATQAARNFYDNVLVDGQTKILNQTRSQGWSILLLVNEFKADGKIKNLTDALLIFEKSLLATEQVEPARGGSNGQGYFVEIQGPHIGVAVVTFATYYLEPIMELHYEAKKAGLDVSLLEAFIKRSLNWLKDYAYVGGKMNLNGEYSALTLSYYNYPDDPSKNTGGQIGHNSHTSGAFAYAYRIFKDSDPTLANSYLQFARKLFRDSVYYRNNQNVGKDDYFDPQRISVPSLNWLPTAPKVMGWLGRSSQFYLSLEYELEKESNNCPFEGKRPLATGEYKSSSHISIETAAGGLGEVFSVTSLKAGEQVQLFAINRTESNNYLSDVSVTWKMNNELGSFSQTSGTSTVFTAKKKGTLVVTADHFYYTDGVTKTITINAGSPTHLSIETSGSGSGKLVLDSYLLINQKLSLYAISRDADENFVANETVDWSVKDLGATLSAASAPSTTLTAKAVSLGTVVATHSTLGTVSTGLQQINADSVMLISDVSPWLVSSKGFSIYASFAGDSNKNSVLKLAYCNETLNSGCAPESGAMVPMTRDTDKIYGLVDSFAVTVNPGDTLKAKIINEDADGVHFVNGAQSEVKVKIPNPKHIYRSMELDRKTAIVSGILGRGLTIKSGRVTFDANLPDDIGVGDVLQFDSDNNLSIDKIVFIHERISANQYVVRDYKGDIPVDSLPSIYKWDILRAHSSLMSAFSHSPNSGIQSELKPLVSGSADITAQTGEDKILHIAVYGGGKEYAIPLLNENNFKTGAGNFLHIFTPTKPSEVGVSQRHSGVWDESKFVFANNTSGAIGLHIFSMTSVYIEGLQMFSENASAEAGVSFRSSGFFRISDSIIRGPSTCLISETNSCVGINFRLIGSTYHSDLLLWNNIIYGWKKGIVKGNARTRGAFVNNTVVNNSSGFVLEGSSPSFTIELKNNIVQRLSAEAGGSDYSLTSFTPSNSNNNISQDGSSFNSSYANKSVIFVDATKGNYHLYSTDTAALGSGQNLSLYPICPLSTDIDGQYRGSVWDIGAD